MRKKQYRPILHPMTMFSLALTGGLATTYVVSSPMFYYGYYVIGCISWVLVYCFISLFITIPLDKPHDESPPAIFTIVFTIIGAILSGAAMSLPFFLWVDVEGAKAWGVAIWIFGVLVGGFYSLAVSDPTWLPEGGANGEQNDE